MPAMAMEAEWDLEAVIGYLGTWSATRRYREARGQDPLATLHRELEELWGEPEGRRNVQWPLGFRVGCIE